MPVSIRSVSEASAALIEVAAALDIPEHMAEDAVLQYESIAAWLTAEDSALRDMSPEIYPQGSFRLGTPIRPLRSGEEFDIDLVCRLHLAKEQVTQTELKRMVGDRLKLHPDLRLTPKRRCWTIKYPERFHLDVLPSIPDLDLAPHGILLTDTELHHWQHSNPIGYADWFGEQMRHVLHEQRDLIAKAANVAVEDVPVWRVRTPLQRAVQLLKRHRDFRFGAMDENRPVSILLTTLAARAYSEERDLSSALANIARNMPRFIENRGGRWWVENPAHPNENFADKWNEKPERREAFLRWLEVVEIDLAEILSLAPGNDLRSLVEKRFGSRPPRRGSVKIDTTAPPLADSSHTQPVPWRERRYYRCTVKGSVHAKIYKPTRLWPLSDRPVPKGVGLRFEATTNTPWPYEVHWQVVNTGHDARAAGGLRGGFERSNGREGIRWESTAYAGTHWIEALIVKDGACVARSGRTLVRVRS